MPTVEDLMTYDVYTCTAGSPLNRAAEQMWINDVGSVAVIDDEGHLVGMITDRDIAMSCLLRGAPLEQIPVAEAMSSEVSSCRPTDDLLQVHETMRTEQVRRMPVVDDHDVLIGLVSLNDLAMSMDEQGATDGLRAVDVARTLRSVSAPRGPL